MRRLQRIISPLRVRRWCLLAVLLLPLLVASGHSEAHPLYLPHVEVQRMEVVGQLGGLVTAGIPLERSLLVMAEGSSLVLLDVSGATPVIRDRRDLGHGVILDMTRAGDLFFVLTEEGVVALHTSGEGLPQLTGFAAGGGQALAAVAAPAGGAVLALAACEGGLRLLRADAQGHLTTPLTLPLPGTSCAVALSADGSRAFVAAGERGIHLVEIRDPSAPRLLRTLTTVQPADAVETMGALLAVASGARIVVLDPAHPDEEGLIGTYDPLREGQRAVVQGEFAYVADSRSGLKILWRAAPDRLVQVYGESHHSTRDLWVEGDLAYVVGSDGLRILNVGNRYRPLEIAHLPLPGEPQGLAVTPQRAFVALGDEGIAVVDIENLGQPRLRRRISVVRGARAVIFHQDTLYAAAGENGLAVIDPAAPGTETLLGTFALPGPALDLAQRGDVLYVAAGEAGLVALDISQPEAPSLVGALPAEADHTVIGVTVAGKRAYLAEGDGFSVVDVSSPYTLGRLARIGMPATHIASGDETLYVLHGNQIALYDAGATADPLLLRVYRGMSKANSLAADGDRLLVSAAGEEGPALVVLSLLAPDRPLELDSTPEGGTSYHAWPTNGEVWLARGYAGLRRYTLTEGGALLAQGGYAAIPAAGRLTQGEHQIAIGGRGGWTRLALGEDGLPLPTGQAIEGLAVRDLALAGDRLAVAAGDRGVALYALADTSSATLIALRQTRGPATGVVLEGNFVYVADAGGLSIFDRRYLQPVAQVSTPAPANGIVLHEGRAYLPLSDGRLAIVALDDPTAGLRVRSSISTRRPHVLIPAPDGRSIYGLADDQLIRLMVNSAGTLTVTQRGQLAALAEGGFFNSGLLWAITSGEALRLYDVSSLGLNGKAILRGQIRAAVQDVAIKGTTAYVAYGTGGLGLFDLLSRYMAPPFYGEEVRALYQKGEMLFAVGQALTAWDISMPTSPVLLASLRLPAPGQHIAPASEGKLLISLESGLAIVGWDGDTLGLIGLLTVPGGVDRAVQIGERAYLAAHQGGLLVADVSDVTHPLDLFRYTSAAGQFVRDLLVLDPQTLLVSWEGGIEALDVSNPAPGPRLLDAPTVTQMPLLDMALSADGRRAAVALGTEGILLVDMPPDGESIPHAVGLADTPGEALHAAWGNAGTLLVADGSCGLRVLDVSHPTDPQERGYWRSGYASDVLVGEAGQIYLAEATQLLVLRYNAGAPPVLPPVPQFATPANGQDGVALTVTLSWGPPPDPCNPLRYRIYLGLSNPPPLIGEVSGDPTLEVSDLRPQQTYYWRVEAIDQQGDRIEGPLWHFTTARADFMGTLPPSPPPLVKRLRQSLFVPAVLIAFAVGAAATAGLIWRLRRRSRRHNAAQRQREG